MDPLSMYDQASVFTYEAMQKTGIHPSAPEYQPLWVTVHDAVLKGMMSLYF